MDLAAVINGEISQFGPQRNDLLGLLGGGGLQFGNLPLGCGVPPDHAVVGCHETGQRGHGEQRQK